ncbi:MULTISPECIES: DOMON domain-containing protein [Dehalogenimonas]|uniref:DOMON domain-containing protein n=1 Tax=Dehalogenimonas TaxID=670486 RepID=UPI0009F81E43
MLTTSASSGSLDFPPGKYQKTQIYNDIFNLSWSSDTTYVYIGLKARTTGWAALSLSSDAHAGDSDTFIGFVQNGQVVFNEFMHIDFTGTHSLDTNPTGVLVSGSENDGITTIEIQT